MCKRGREDCSPRTCGGDGSIIGIPVKSSTLDGLDALLATVQMPSGMPVATVAIDGAANAALLAVQILSVGDDELSATLDAKRAEAGAKVLSKDAEVSQKYSCL